MVTGAAGLPLPATRGGLAGLGRRGQMPDRLRRDLQFILADDDLASDITPSIPRPSLLRRPIKTAALMGAAAFLALAAGTAALLDRSGDADGPRFAETADPSSTEPAPALADQAASDIHERQALQPRRALAARSAPGRIGREGSILSLDAAWIGAEAALPDGVLDAEAAILEVEPAGRAEPSTPTEVPQRQTIPEARETEPVVVLAETPPGPPAADPRPNVGDPEPARPASAANAASPSRPGVAGRRDSADAIRDLRRQW